MARLRMTVMVLLLAGVGGCARYEYAVVQPEPIAGPVGEGDAFRPYPPLEYNFADLGDQLGIRIANPTAGAVRIVGALSYVVDPAGQTHALGDALIAPQSYVDMVLPPRPPVYRYRTIDPFPRYHYGPRRYGRRGYVRAYAPAYPAVRDVYVTPPYDPAVYWTWGTGPVRLRLVYDTQIEAEGLQEASHEFLLVRERVE